MFRVGGLRQVVPIDYLRRWILDDNGEVSRRIDVDQEAEAPIKQLINVDMDEEIVQRFGFRRRDLAHILEALRELDIRRLTIQDPGQGSDGFLYQVREKSAGQI